MKTAEDLVGLAPFGLLQLDARRRITAANRETQAILGHSERLMLRRPLSEIIFHDSPIFDLIDRAIENSYDMVAHNVSIMGPGFGKQAVLDVKLRPTGDGGIVLGLIQATQRDVVDNPAGVAAFGRILGHEVKNPLAGISGAAQLLRRSARDDQVGMLDIIQSETQRIERLISRLSAFELFSAPRQDIFNIHEILEQVIAAEQAAQGSRLHIRRAFDPSLPELEGDRDHLHEALQNLVRNAAEAAIGHDAEPQVRLETAFETSFGFLSMSRDGRLGRALRVTVEDNGPGIPPEKRGRMFEMFTSSKSGGRGLGLNVVSEIINAHKGRIRVDSQPGKTRFSIYLPLSRKSQR